MICDIGGSSMELAEIQDGRVGKRVTSQLGPLKLRDLPDGEKGRAKFIKKTLEALSEELGPQHDRLFLVGGSWRAIARIDMHRRNYPLHVLHEYRMSVASVQETADYIHACEDLEALRKECGISSARMSLVPLAIEVLLPLVEILGPKDIAISSYGIREGMLYEQMPTAVRDRDPLIEACRFSEYKDARLPGFGGRLYDFVLPLFQEAPSALRRLVHAACLLHDVSWRAHPDYRAETCFDNATRANLGGLKHSERVFLGLALLHRYRNKREGTRFEDMYSLLEPEYQTQAEVLGKAMRLGSMLWMTDVAQEDTFLALNPDDGSLTLTLSPEAAPLFGEVAQSRFESLSRTLNAKPVVLRV